MNGARQLRGPRASTLFPVLAYAAAEGLFLLDDASLAFGFLCEPLAGRRPGPGRAPLGPAQPGLAEGRPAAGDALGLARHRGAPGADAGPAHRARRPPVARGDDPACRVPAPGDRQRPGTGQRAAGTGPAGHRHRQAPHCRRGPHRGRAARGVGAAGRYRAGARHRRAQAPGSHRRPLRAADERPAQLGRGRRLARPDHPRVRAPAPRARAAPRSGSCHRGGRPRHHPRRLPGADPVGEALSGPGRLRHGRALPRRPAVGHPRRAPQRADVPEPALSRARVGAGAPDRRAPVGRQHGLRAPGQVPARTRPAQARLRRPVRGPGQRRPAAQGLSGAGALHPAQRGGGGALEPAHLLARARLPGHGRPFLQSSAVPALPALRRRARGAQGHHALPHPGRHPGGDPDAGVRRLEGDGNARSSIWWPAPGS